MHHSRDRRHKPRVLRLMLDDFPRAIGRRLHPSTAFYTRYERGGVVTVSQHAPDDFGACLYPNSGVHEDFRAVTVERDVHRDLSVCQLTLHSLILEPATLGPGRDREEGPQDRAAHPMLHCFTV